MKEAMMGLEIEFGLRADLARLHSFFANQPHQPHHYLSFILSHVAEVLPPECYLNTGSIHTGFWTRGGARCYPDRENNLEFATPECHTLAELVFQRNVGLRLVQALVSRAKLAFRREPYCYDGPLDVIANNTALQFQSVDGGGETTFGCHENYLLRRPPFVRSMPDSLAVFSRIFSAAGAFFCCRPVLSGSGHINLNGDFLLSPRMGWITQGVGGGTTASRPLVNTRDEAHADNVEFFRYHHIAGDTNITDNITRMTIAFTYWVLKMIERGWEEPYWMRTYDFRLLAQGVNRDPELKATFYFNGISLTAVEVLETYLAAVDRMSGKIGFEEEDEEIFKDIAEYLRKARDGFEALVGNSEWATKYLVIRAEAERMGGISFSHPRLRAISMALHNINQDPSENPFIRVRNEILPPNQDIGELARAAGCPPLTRAFVRGLAIFLAKKRGLDLRFASASEWSSFYVYEENAPVSRTFLLNRDTPWKVCDKDLKDLKSYLRSVLAGA